MISDGIFCVEWETGHIHARISSFFTEAKVPQVKKLFKLAKQYSTEADRAELLSALSHEDEARKSLLDTLEDQRRQCDKMANDFFGTKVETLPGWAEKRIIRERAKLAKCIQLLADERWDI